MEEKVLEKISAWKIDGWDDLIQGKFFFGRKILVNKLPGGKSSGKRWGQTDILNQSIHLLNRRSPVRILVGAGVFLIFFYQNETNGEEICGHQRVCVLS